MRFRLLTALVALGCAACSPGGDAIIGGNHSAQAPASWDDFVKDSTEQWFKLDPAFAIYQGRHDFDGQLPDWSAKGLQAKSNFLKETVRKARTYSNLTKQQQFERDYIIKVADGQLFWLEDADLPHRNPSYYVGGGLDPNVYIARNYADPKARMRAVIEFFDKVPAAAQQILGAQASN